MTTLIVAGHYEQYLAIQKQIADRDRAIYVTFPGASVPSQRFDTILVTDYYWRVFHFSSGEEQTIIERWFEECVRVRLSGPTAKIINL